jgi:hypothetical protein
MEVMCRMDILHSAETAVAVSADPCGATATSHCSFLQYRVRCSNILNTKNPTKSKTIFRLNQFFLYYFQLIKKKKIKML